MTDQWLERVNAALHRYDQNLLDVRGVADALRGPDPTAEPVQVLLYGGPVSGATPTLKIQPARIEIAGRYVYVRVDDPDTGKSLNFYAYLED